MMASAHAALLLAAALLPLSEGAAPTAAGRHQQWRWRRAQAVRMRRAGGDPWAAHGIFHARVRSLREVREWRGGAVSEFVPAQYKHKAPPPPYACSEFW